MTETTPRTYLRKWFRTRSLFVLLLASYMVSTWRASIRTHASLALPKNIEGHPHIDATFHSKTKVKKRQRSEDQSSDRQSRSRQEDKDLEVRRIEFSPDHVPSRIKNSTIRNVGEQKMKGEKPKKDTKQITESRRPEANEFKSSPDLSSSLLPTKEERKHVQEYLHQTIGRFFLPLAAVLETSPWTHPILEKPLPIRDQSSLRTVEYPQHLQSCEDIPNRWPTIHDKSMDAVFGPNVGKMKPTYKIREEYAETVCPVDADPFLPWIHDIFPSVDGKFIEVVAHNKRRCKRDPKHFGDDIRNLEPQVALLQAVPIQRISTEQFQDSEDGAGNFTNIPAHWKTSTAPGEYRYRLVPIQEADADGKETRFICHFHTLRPKPSGHEGVDKVILGETLSVFPYNYEHANYRHRRGQMANPMFTRPQHSEHSDGIHNEQVWNAILHARCPVPSYLQSAIREGSSITQNSEKESIPSIYVDLVPIRTNVRENLTGYAPQILELTEFDPIEEWGTGHVLPPVNESGRWANIPICHPPRVETSKQDAPFVLSTAKGTKEEEEEKPHFMVGCLWASAVFSERSSTEWDTHTSARLLEWLTYHLEVAGFDHMVVYDNTGAHTNLTSLKQITDLFPSSQVTRVPWSHRICNNNGVAQDNAGERSSQYAAEASCRIRYGPTTEWLASFDTDEYLIPSGNWSNLREWLSEGVRDESIAEDTHILSFYETKAFLNKRFTERFYDESRECNREAPAKYHCLAKRENATFLESFCEPFPFPREHPKTKAKMKQIYRPSFVLNHFVHYSAVTRLVFDKPRHARVVGWPYERRAKELTEAYMVHTKTRLPATTYRWNSSQCQRADKCSIGIPFPHYQGENITAEEDMVSEYGFPYNCYELRAVQEKVMGRLKKALAPLQKRWKPNQFLATNGN